MLAKGIQLTAHGPVIPPGPAVVMTPSTTSGDDGRRPQRISAVVQFSAVRLNRSSDRRGQSTSIGMPPLRVMLVVTLNGTPAPPSTAS